MYFCSDSYILLCNHFSIVFGINLNIRETKGEVRKVARKTRKTEDKVSPLQKISDMLELPADTITKLFRMESIGGRELTLENVGGILEYSQECVRLSVKTGVVSVRGSMLEIKAMSGDGIYICGKIRVIEFLEA